MSEKLSEELRNKIIEMYQATGLGAPEISRQLGLHKKGSTVYRTLHAAGIFPSEQLRDDYVDLNSHIYKFSKEEQEKMVESYRLGSSTHRLCELYDCSFPTVIKVLRQNGVTTARRGKRGVKFTEEQSRLALDMWDAGDSTAAISRYFKVSSTTMKRFLISHSRNRIKGFIKNIQDEQINNILQWWNSGISQVEISKKLGVHQTSISRVVARFSDSLDNRRPRRESHGNWKGGLIKIGGRTHVLVEPNHRFVSMATEGGYILENRLRMAEHLDRPLLATETVHHKDGNILNDSIENLQLRQGGHGKGTVFKCNTCGSLDVIASEL